MQSKFHPHSCLAVLFACGSALPLFGQSPLWAVRFNDVAFASDSVTAVRADEAGGVFVVGFNDSGWSVWRIRADGQTQWYWQGAGLPRGDGQPLIAGLDSSDNIVLIAGSGYGLATARISADGQSADVHEYDSPASIESAVLTPGGDIVATGSVASSDEYDYDAITIAFAPDGRIAWTAIYNSPADADDSGAALAIGPTGDVYVAGWAGSYAGSLRNRGYACLVLRYTSDGDLVWDSIVEFDPSNPDERLLSASLAVDSDGNAYVGGRQSLTAGSQAMLFKVASSGMLLWHDESFGPLYTYSIAGNPRVLLDEARSAVYLAGDVRRNTTDSDFNVLRYSPDGKHAWTASYDGPAHGLDYVASADLDSAGHIHLIGTSYASSGNPDLIAVEFDESGQQVTVGRSDNTQDGYDRARTGAIDADGNAYAVGGAFADYFDSRVVRFNSSATIDWSILLSTTVGSDDGVADVAIDGSGAVFMIGTSDRRRNENSAILARYSSTGALQWMQRLPNAFREPGAVVVDSDGNALVLARYAGDNPMGLLKYASDGSLIWSGHYPAPDLLSFVHRRMALDPQGNYSLCGSVEHYNPNANSDYDALLVSIDANGALRWSRSLTGSRVEMFTALGGHASGAMVVAGFSREHLYDSPSEIVTIRYSSEGVEEWQRRLIRPDSSDYDSPVAARVSADGTAFIAVIMGGPHPFLSLLCYAADGTLNWTRDFQLIPAAGTQPVDMRFDSNGNVIVLCVATMTDHTYDVLLVSYSPSGEQRWVHHQAGPAQYSELSRYFDITATDQIIVSADTYPGSSYQFYNSMLLRLDADGAPHWMSRQPHPADLSGWVVALQATSDGGFVAAGNTESLETRGDFLIVRYGPPAAPCQNGNPCSGDLNDDCRVDVSDLEAVLSNFGNMLAVGFAPANGDVDLDGDVDLRDLAAMLAGWGNDCR